MDRTIATAPLPGSAAADAAALSAARALEAATPQRTPLFPPVSTYRFQFNRDFTFNQAASLVDYLRELGIGDGYASPFFSARSGSSHGYDVTDHGTINREIGTEDDFVALASRLRENRMGLMMDVVPNHMCIAGGENQWWASILENGPASPYSRYFDILWRPPKTDLENKVLLPFLGDQYGRALENKQIQVQFLDGAFFASYFDFRLPLAPRTWIMILEPTLARLKARLNEGDAPVMELGSVITALSHLPSRTETDPDKLKERAREREVTRKRLATLYAESEEFRDALDADMTDLNGTKGEPRSFDRLEAILQEQSFRLCFWRVAADEINYRRFFDISDLAAIRVEESEVFDAVHALVLRLVALGWVTGLRIDHVDGLYDPKQYLEDLQSKCRAALESGAIDLAGRRDATDAAARDFYVVVEKILIGDERLRSDWRAFGTTGYDFANDLNGLYVEPANRRRFQDLYARFIGRRQVFPEVLAQSKKFIMLIALASELRVLAIQLDRISEQHRWSRDFTLESLRFALREVIAYFPVYRSYIRSMQGEVSPLDRHAIGIALREAKRHNPATSASIFDFIRDVLLLEDPEGLTDEQKMERRAFVMRFQQLTSPVTAKGMEDTAFYRYFPLASLNEVGGDPERFGVAPRAFHEKNEERSAHWPYTLLATTTHDTKRSEDVRARINVLSEIPVRWYRSIRRWQSLNESKRGTVADAPAPDSNDEYLLYQTLVGTWPLRAMTEAERKDYLERIENYMMKALKEAKVHTSWINVNEGYEAAVKDFVKSILTPGPENRFLEELETFVASVQRAGLMNALSQLAVKIASPGVPDFYQGTELWNFSLVDPDNRRPVDYDLRRQILAGLSSDVTESNAGELMSNVEDGRIKMHLMRQGLALRHRKPALFTIADYKGLPVDGELKNHVIAFARSHGKDAAICVASRFFTGFSWNDRGWLDSGAWAGTAVSLGASFANARFRDVYTGRELSAERMDGKVVLRVGSVLATLPAALLERVS